MPAELGPLTAMAPGVGDLLGSLRPGHNERLDRGFRVPFAVLASVALLILIAAIVGLKPRG